MTSDDLSAPLGRETRHRGGLSATIVASIPHVLAIVLATFVGVFVLWAFVADNPYGGEPMAVVEVTPRVATAPRVVSGPSAHEMPAIADA